VAAGRRIGTDLVFAMLNDIRELPLLLTADEAAGLLRTTRKAIYVMAARRRLPGVTHVGRRMLVRRDDLLHWLDQSRAPSLKESQR
jgi:excisionase family DNA binding protein